MNTVAPVLSGHLWDNAKLAAKDRWPLIPGFKIMEKKPSSIFILALLHRFINSICNGGVHRDGECTARNAK